MLRTLVIDDSALMRTLIARAAESCGSLVTQATTGEGAITALNAGPFSLVFLAADALGPDAAGLLQRLGEDRGRTPVVICSALDHRVLAEALGPLHPVAYLSKPFQREEVVHLIRKVAVPLPPLMDGAG